jgi:hypothetical protein
LLSEISGELGTRTGKTESLVRLLYKTVTDGISDKFSEAEQRGGK